MCVLMAFLSKCVSVLDVTYFHVNYFSVYKTTKSHKIPLFDATICESDIIL